MRGTTASSHNKLPSTHLWEVALLIQQREQPDWLIEKQILLEKKNTGETLVY